MVKNPMLDSAVFKLPCSQDGNYAQCSPLPKENLGFSRTKFFLGGQAILPSWMRIQQQGLIWIWIKIVLQKMFSVWHLDGLTQAKMPLFTVLVSRLQCKKFKIKLYNLLHRITASPFVNNINLHFLLCVHKYWIIYGDN